MKTHKKPNASPAAKPSTKADCVTEGPATCSPQPFQRIAERAYYLYLSEGCPCGQDQRHWLEAEAQLAEDPTPPASDPSVGAC